MSIENSLTSHLPAPSLPMLSRTLPIRRFLDRLVGDVLAQAHASRGGAASVVGWPLRLVDVLMLRVHLLNAPFGLDARLEQRQPVSRGSSRGCDLMEFAVATPSSSAAIRSPMTG